ncbi:MAG TPA: MFS transporter, partial [Acidimicrobiales bacterium]|nr:MFS transporter [Acidimicrobiales bacterium]
MDGSDDTGKTPPGRVRTTTRIGKLAGERPQWFVTLAGLFLAVTVYGFQQTAITPALPVVQQDLGASREWTTWLLSGYFIVASVTPVFLGKLADRSGKRRIFLVALGVFLVGSVGSA